MNYGVSTGVEPLKIGRSQWGKEISRNDRHCPDRQK